MTSTKLANNKEHFGNRITLTEDSTHIHTHTYTCQPMQIYLHENAYVFFVHTKFYVSPTHLYHLAPKCTILLRKRKLRKHFVSVCMCVGVKESKEKRLCERIYCARFNMIADEHCVTYAENTYTSAHTIPYISMYMLYVCMHVIIANVCILSELL